MFLLVNLSAESLIFPILRVGVISGLGPKGYELALDYVLSDRVAEGGATDDEKNARLDFLARLTACTKADVAFSIIQTKSPQMTSNID